MSEEEWREIAGAPKYLISNEGKVRNRVTGNIIKPIVSNRNKPYVHIQYVDGRFTTRPVDKLVAQSFDGEKRDSKFDWTTQEHIDRSNKNERTNRKLRRSRYDPKTGKTEEIE